MENKLSEVLRLVNAARAALSLPALCALPKGVIASPHSCPLARALGVESNAAGVDLDVVSFSTEAAAIAVARAWEKGFDRSGAVYLPSALTEFVERFDDGCCPELVENAA